MLVFSYATAVRDNLILHKLDPLSAWTQHRREGAVTVERQNGRIVKTLRGLMAGLTEHELGAYFEVFSKRAQIPRVATFNRLETSESSLFSNTIILKDYGPDLLDWLHLISPPRLEPKFRDTSLPTRVQQLGPLRDSRVLLSLARSLLEALAPFHRAGFVHCDIKHDNFCIQHRLANDGGVSLSHPIMGEVDFDTLTAIDLGCCLLPRDNHRRQIHYTHDSHLPLYIGALHRQAYIWPALLGAQTEDEARKAAEYIMANGWTGKSVAIPKPVGAQYVSDHYLLCCELAVLGAKGALDRLDWRIDFFSLGHLLESILGHIAYERSIEAPSREIEEYLAQLPTRLKSYDTVPFEQPTSLPHNKLIAEIDSLIGATNFRRVPIEIMPRANPVPWFEGPPETTLTEVAGSHETPLRGGSDLGLNTSKEEVLPYDVGIVCYSHNPDNCRSPVLKAGTKIADYGSWTYYTNRNGKPLKFRVDSIGTGIDFFISMSKDFVPMPVVEQVGEESLHPNRLIPDGSRNVLVAFRCDDVLKELLVRFEDAENSQLFKEHRLGKLNLAAHPSGTISS